MDTGEIVGGLDTGKLKEPESNPIDSHYVSPSTTNEVPRSRNVESSIFGIQPKKQEIHNFGNIKFEVDSRYQQLQPIGKGSFGVVASAWDSVKKKRVAIKKVSQIFRHSRAAEQLFREIFLLKQFKHENILKLEYIERPLNTDQYNDVYIVTELMNFDLRKLIYSNVCFNEVQIKNIMYQILISVNYLHRQRIIHRDLKPSNILVNVESGTIKLADFGLSTLEHKGMDRNVVTRWYRAPELLLPFGDYDRAIDIWSLGCIFSELIRRMPLFPGTNNENQIRKIVEFFGEVQCFQKDQGQGSSNDNHCCYKTSQIKHITEGMLKNYQKDNLKKFLGEKMNPQIIDVIVKMLTYCPKKRITAYEALHHPFFADILKESDITKGSTVDFTIFKESFGFNSHKYRKIISEQIDNGDSSPNTDLFQKFKAPIPKRNINNTEKTIEKKDVSDRDFYKSVNNFINSDLPKFSSFLPPKIVTFDDSGSDDDDTICFYDETAT